MGVADKVDFVVEEADDGAKQERFGPGEGTYLVLRPGYYLDDLVRAPVSETRPVS